MSKLLQLWFHFVRGGKCLVIGLVPEVVRQALFFCKLWGCDQLTDDHKLVLPLIMNYYSLRSTIRVGDLVQSTNFALNPRLLWWIGGSISFVVSRDLKIVDLHLIIQCLPCKTIWRNVLVTAQWENDFCLHDMWVLTPKPTCQCHIDSFYSTVYFLLAYRYISLQTFVVVLPSSDLCMEAHCIIALIFQCLWLVLFLVFNCKN
jgi:hypothetical protein